MFKALGIRCGWLRYLLEIGESRAASSVSPALDGGGGVARGRVRGGGGGVHGDDRIETLTTRRDTTCHNPYPRLVRT